MNATLLAALNDAERLLVAETEPDALAVLDEDAVGELHGRVRRARNKYIGQTAAARALGSPNRGVAARPGRGTGRPPSRPRPSRRRCPGSSRRLSVLSRQAAAELRADRLAAARAANQGQSPAEPPMAPSRARTVTDRPRGDRALRSPASEKNRAGTTAAGARRQAKRDAR